MAIYRLLVRSRLDRLARMMSLMNLLRSMRLMDKAEILPFEDVGESSQVQLQSQRA